MGTQDVSETPRHSVSVAAAIFDESGENVLLIKRRDNGQWEPPGGVLELDETMEDGLRREVHEETGADIEIGPLTGIYKNMAHGIVALVFRAKATSEPHATSEEAAEVRWFLTRRISDLMTEAYSVRIYDAMHVDAVAIRQHDGRNIMHK